MPKRRLLGSFMLALALLTPVLGPTPRADAQPASAKANDTDKFVEIHMADGRIIKGELISETTSEYVVMAKLMDGFPAVETTLRKSSVVKIVRGAKSDDATPSKPAPKADAKNAPDTSSPAPKTDTAGGTKIVLTRVDGQIGFDFSRTPLTKFFRLVDQEFNDVGADGRVVSEHRKDHIVVFRFNTETNIDQGIDGLFSIMDIKEIIQEEIVKGRRIVFWIEKGINGAALLPLMSPEIYFTDNGILNVTSDLEDFDWGDPVVREKQISLRMGHAEGFALLGGYGDVGAKLVRAMTRRSFPFWYKKQGGRVLATNDAPPADEADQWIQLSDDGKGENKDDPDDITTLYGNDRVWLDAGRAYDLGISQGVANTLDDLAFQLGVNRNFKQVLKDGGEDLFRRWRAELERALALVAQGNNGRPRGELWRQYDKANELNTPQARLGRQKNALEKIVSYLQKYKEVLDPNEQTISQLNVQIEQLKQQIMLANRQNQN